MQLYLQVSDDKAV